MTNDAMAITAICSRLCVGDGVSPFQPKEWNELAGKLHGHNMRPSVLFELSEDEIIDKFQLTQLESDRIMKLIGRAGSLAFDLAELENLGIRIITRADDDYPSKLKEKLRTSCPPLFYYAGDLSLLNGKAMGFVGSRSIEIADAEFAKDMVRKAVSCGYTVVSGGARGIDSMATGTSLALGGNAVEFLADSMLKRMKNADVYSGIADKRLLLISAVKPDAGFDAGNAMARNKYIYAQSEGTVVVKSDYNKGGTWSGANENLKNKWCPLFCWNNPDYKGNQELIKSGATSISESWDVNIENAELSDSNFEIYEQQSFFDNN